MDQAVGAYLTQFNRAVRSGDWGGFAQRFTDDAVVVFENVPVPPLHGREAIEAGYREAPPDDTITAVGYRVDGDVHEVTYRWDEGTGGGRLLLTMRDGLVAHGVVTLAHEVASSA